MTVNTTLYTPWQSMVPGAPFTSNAPALVVLNDYMLKRWGGQDLGCYGVRPIRGGEAPSTHSFGAARDWRWLNPGPGRAVLDNEILPWLINNSAELHIQAIHDYSGINGTGRIWRSTRNDGKGAYWKDQADSSSGMGQSWANWIHYEVTQQGWADGRPIEAKLTNDPMVPAPTLRVGDHKFEVANLVGHLRFWGWSKVPAGTTMFGSKVEGGVKRMQAAVGATPDGVYGPGTAAAYKRWIENL